MVMGCCVGLALLLCGIITSSYAAPSNVHRQLNMTLNPNCNIAACKHASADDAINLIHITAVGPDDMIHYIWSTIGAPTVLIVYAQLDSQLHINWEKLLSHNTSDSAAISISGEKYSFAVIFNKLWEFDDANDTAKIDDVTQNSTYFTSHDLSKATWQDFGKSMVLDEFSGTFNSTHTDFMNGTLRINLRAFTESGRHTVLPRLYYTSNSTQFDVILDKLVPRYNHSRFAVEFEIVSSYKPSDVKLQGMKVETSKSIDDEYTPGVFEILDVKSPTPDPDSPCCSGYMEWKPVCYTKPHHTIEDSVRSVAYRVTRLTGSLGSYSVAAQYYPADRLPHVLIYATNVSYGMQEDGYYNAVNYTFWSASVGYGTPPEDSVSTTLLIIIAAGVGIPVLLILVGGTALAIKRHQDKGRARGRGNGEVDERTALINDHHTQHSINT